MRALVALALVASLVAAACGSGEEHAVARSGFLGDYSQLEPGKGDQPSLLYIHPTADFFAYDRVVIDPVAVWHGGGSSPDRLPLAELRELAGRFESAIRTRMQGSMFEVVSESGPGTLRIRAAITGGTGADTKLDLGAAGATAPPTGKLGTDTVAFLKRGALELEVVDAVTSERLVGAVDDRLVAEPGEPAAPVEQLTGDAFAWSDVEAAFDARARLLAARLSALHQLGGPNEIRSAD